MKMRSKNDLCADVYTHGEHTGKNVQYNTKHLKRQSQRPRDCLQLKHGVNSTCHAGPTSFAFASHYIKGQTECIIDA